MTKHQPSRLFQKFYEARDARRHHRPSKSDEISDAAVHNIRMALTAAGEEISQESDDLSIVSGTFQSRKTNQHIMTDSEIDVMRASLGDAARGIMKQRMDLPRKTREETDPPCLHHARKVSVEGRGLKIDIAGMAKEGRNIIAIPSLSQDRNGHIHIGRAARLVEIDCTTDMTGPITIPPDSAVRNARKIHVETNFETETQRRMKQANMARG